VFLLKKGGGGGGSGQKNKKEWKGRHLFWTCEEESFVRGGWRERRRNVQCQGNARNMQREGGDSEDCSAEIHCRDVAGELELGCGSLLGVQDLVDDLANSGEEVGTEEVTEDCVFVVPEFLVFFLHEGLLITVDLGHKAEKIWDGVVVREVGQVVRVLRSKVGPEFKENFVLDLGATVLAHGEVVSVLEGLMIVDGNDVVTHNSAHFFCVAISQGRVECRVPRTESVLGGRVLFVVLRIHRITLPAGVMDAAPVHNEILAGGIKAVVAKRGQIGSLVVPSASGGNHVSTPASCDVELVVFV